MTATATRTLEATLVPPTTHKERRLQRTVATYRRALKTAFNRGADTRSAVNDIVTDYDLTSYAKDALKKYVPQLHETYNSSQLDDDHPVRFTNRGWSLDWSDDRQHEYCWRVPQAGRGNAFWIPLRINPSQEGLWGDILDGDASVGEFRLQEDQSNWILHVTVEYPIAKPDVPGDPTPVGFDIGETQLLTGCAYQEGTPTQPFVFDGGRARHLRKEMFTTLRRLQQRSASEWRIDERSQYYQNSLTDIIEKASRKAITYASRFEDPVIVLEDLTYIRENLDYGKWMNRRLHNWAFARLINRIEDKALDAGIPVRFVNPAYTSKTCHSCGHIGSRPEQAEFRCENSNCWVSEYQADINAAANIASRFDPWGEKCPVKSGTNDLPRDGSACGSTAERREEPEESGQSESSEDSSETSLSTEASPVGDSET